jgi:hypothetical protein
MAFVADFVAIGSMIMVTLFSLWMLKQLFSSSN